MGELLAQVGDLVFSLVISYLGALEFYYVVRHLYHWSFRHPNEVQNDADGLRHLQDEMRNKLASAEAKEAKAGAKAMQDGVFYKDGFRIDPHEKAKHKDEQKTEAEKQQRRKEIEAELTRQKRIEEQIRQELEKAEAELEIERKKLAAEEEQRNAEALIMAERLKEEQQRQLEIEEQERAENERRIVAAEEARAAEQRQREEEQKAKAERSIAAEQQRLREEQEKAEAERIIAAEQQRLREEAEKDEAERSIAAEQQRLREEAEKAESERSIAAEQQRLEETRNARMAQFEVEREKEEQQLQLELTRAAEEEARRMVQAIREQEEQEKVTEENDQQLIEAEKLREQEQRREEEERERLFLIESAIIPQQSEAELEEQQAARLLLEAEREHERKQRIVEENARKFLEAEQEMVEMQRLMEEAVQQRHVPLNQQVSIVEEPCIKKEIKPLEQTEPMTQSVKTQFKQSSKSLFPGISDDGSSIEPNTSSEQSSFSRQLSEEIAAHEREAPEGEDNALDMQYTDEYLRSLDGIKQKPLVREDGSGRRRAFKKRRSSGSSNSSRDSRTSREEEIKMFTSLEEEEMHEKKKGDEDFTAIKYTSEPTLKVKGHHRRHKRSPAKDVKPSEESVRSSLEKLNEEQTNPWGDVLPEHYKETAFWKREKEFSIDEEDVEHQMDITKATPKTSSFEQATPQQHELAMTALQKQTTKETEEQENSHISDDTTRKNESSTNLQTSQNTERASSPARSSCSPRLRRSPRIDELDQYEEHERQTAVAGNDDKNLHAAAGSPSIIVESAADTAPWRDAHGLLLQGLSDFYDFSASTNPSRSRPTSRAGTPTSPKPNITFPKNVVYEQRPESTEILDVYDDTDSLEKSELNKQSLMNFLDKLDSPKEIADPFQELCVNNKHLAKELKKVADDPNRRPDIALSIEVMPLVVVHSADEVVLAETIMETTLPNSKSPTELEVSGTQTQYNENVNSEDDMNKLVESLRQERCRSRSRSRSPLPTSHNIERSIESRRQKRIQLNDELFVKLERTSSPESNQERIDVETPSISVECAVDSKITPIKAKEANEFSEIIGLVESLRLCQARSRSHSKSPKRVPTEANVSHSVEARRNILIKQNDELLAEITEKAKTPEALLAEVPEFHSPTRSKISDSVTKPENVAYGFVASSSRRSNFEDNDAVGSHLQHLSDYYDFHQMLNLEASRNKTLAQNTEELESALAVKQCLMDEEAMKKLQTLNDELELRTLTSTDSVVDKTKSDEEEDSLGRAFDKNTLRRLKCTPTTPDYDRSISTEFKDVQRIKEEILASGFKRSTYVGESMDLGSEYEGLRREAANFRRSQSRSRSPIAQEDNVIQLARDEAAKARQIQADILAEITTNIQDEPSHGDIEEKHGAKPKTEFKKSPIDLEHSFSKECADTQRIKDEQLNSGFQRSTYVGESLDMSAQYEQMRRDVAEFRRSRSKSRSPLDAKEVQMIAEIDAEAAKRELQDQILDEITKTTINFQDFSRHLNADFLDNDRRASDSALMQKPEILFQLQDSDPDLDMDPEEYHHFRRFSLRQEEPVEEYPSDSDFMYMSQMEMCSPSGSRTWTREDYYSNNLENLRIEFPDILNSPEISAEELGNEGGAPGHDDEETDGSEDERRTVVDVDDEIEEDIGDFNERGTGDESHHEQSECEEADREVDRYAHRRAEDWKNMENVMEVGFYGPRQHDSEVEEEGAVGGLGGNAALTYDSDSFAIDEIYDEAIRNRKQSGILRDYDSILQEIQPTNYAEDSESGQGYEDNWQNNVDRYALWAKTRELERAHSQLANSADSALNFIESEHRYLGDAATSARSSTRLRSRYGFMPVLQRTDLPETVVDVDLNYKPKREYNWRKNFKLDEDEDGNGQEKEPNDAKDVEIEDTNDMYEEPNAQLIDIRKFSLGGESITLFSRSPDRELLVNLDEEEGAAVSSAAPEHEINDNKIAEAAKNTKDNSEKTKKKKSKRKTRRESKENIDRYAKDEEDSETQIYSRRSSSIQMETDSPKRKSRSRKNSKNSLNNENSLELYSPRGSIDEPLEGFTREYADEATSQKKKTKKRKKTKESKFIHEPKIKEEHFISEIPMELHPTENILSVSAAITPDSAEAIGLLSTLSTTNSVCVTPASIESIESYDSTSPKATETATTATTNTATVDTFDILKDGNLYPLF